jgi:hypothetical protein
MDLFRTKERGELVNHEDVEKVTGVARAVSPNTYYDLVEWCKKHHEEERGISIKNEPLVGYYLATAEQQLAILAERTRRGRRQITKGCKSVEALPDDHVTDHQRRLRDALAESGRSQARAILQSNRLHDFLMRRKPGEPLRINLREDKESA